MGQALLHSSPSVQGVREDQGAGRMQACWAAIGRALSQLSITAGCKQSSQAMLKQYNQGEQQLMLRAQGKVARDVLHLHAQERLLRQTCSSRAM